MKCVDRYSQTHLFWSFGYGLLMPLILPPKNGIIFQELSYNIEGHMLYKSGQDYLKADEKSVALFGMSGLGKTYISNFLRMHGNWFHYSVDYRIGTRYMSEPIVDNFKKEAMKSPLLRELLMSDSIYIASNITFNNLSPLSSYLGKPGDPNKGGIPFEEYQLRQNQHQIAEINATKDMAHFKKRAKEIYGYSHFIADCSGSLCEIVGDNIEQSEVMKEMSKTALPVWIESPENHAETLLERFRRAPKPMYYRPEFLLRKWAEYLDMKGQKPEEVDPDDFAIWGYEALLHDRMPRYRSMAQNWGITVSADEISQIDNIHDFNTLIASKL